jgi:hypothetical protein
MRTSFSTEFGKLPAGVLFPYDVLTVGRAEHDALAFLRATFRMGKTGKQNRGSPDCKDRGDTIGILGVL